MRMLWTILLLLVSATSLLAVDEVRVTADPLAPPNGRGLETLDQGGDNCAASILISAVPYTDTGTTTGRVNDWNTAGSCAGGGGTSNAPDVIYRFVPPVAGTYAISTCGSAFNTLLEVRYNGACPGTIQAGCADAGCGGDAELRMSLSVATYYIIVDGWGTQSGNYTFSIRALCNVYGHPADLSECVETVDSSHARLDCNGGPCNTLFAGTANYSALLCGQTVFGKGFTYTRAGVNLYDTDWFRFSLSEACTVRISCEAEFPSMISAGVQLGSCADHGFTAFGNTCTPYTLTIPNVAAGDYEFTVRPWDVAGIPTALDYRVTLECAPMSGCRIDGTIAAPGSASGTTVGAGNHCAFEPTEDRTYRVYIPVAGPWTFSMCGSLVGWEPIMYLSHYCCDTASIIAARSNGCPGSTWAPYIACETLEADTYFVTIEGRSTDFGQGDYTLTVEPCGCIMDSMATAPTIISGNTCAAGNDCNFRESEDLTYWIYIPVEFEWTFDLCGSPSWWNAKILLSETCCDTVNNWQSYHTNCLDFFMGMPRIHCVHLEPGYYAVTIEGDGATAPCGEFELKVSVCSQRCCYGSNFDLCADATESNCDALGGIWDPFRKCLDEGGCMAFPECPDATEFSQRPHAANHAMKDLFTSEYYYSSRHFDKVYDLTAGAAQLRFWGSHDAYGAGACSMNPTRFRIEFYGDTTVFMPGSFLWGFDTTLLGTPEPDLWDGDTIFYYDVTLPRAVAGTFWLGVFGHEGSDCYFKWATSPFGYNVSYFYHLDPGVGNGVLRSTAFCLGGCPAPDSLVLQSMGGDTMRLAFYAPTETTYRFFYTTHINSIFPVDYIEFHSATFAAGSQTQYLLSPPSQARFVVTTDCAPAAPAATAAPVRVLGSR